MQFIRREIYLEKIRPFIDTDLIKVFTGMRRSGKSVLLSQIADDIRARGISEKRILMLNFESFANRGLCDAETLHDFIKKKASSQNQKIYIFLDEIQEVAGWQKCVNSLRVSLDCDIYITGSNANLLSGELATYLAGRYVEIEVFPFSFGEFISLNDEGKYSVREEFTRYLRFGGMPYLRNLGYADKPSHMYLTDLFGSVVLKDIISRNKIRNVELLSRFVEYMVMNIGQPFSSVSIVKFLKNEHIRITSDTILNYVNACCDCFLLKKVSRIDLSGKGVLSTNEKYYLCDHAVRNAVDEGKSMEYGLLLENIVCMELLRRGYKVHVGKAGTKEIDFVASNNGERIYIQVCYLLATPETVEREFSPFRKLQDRYPCLVVSMDELDMSRDGVKHYSVWDFLLKEKW